MPVYDSVLDLIGNTPMVDVSALSPNPRVRIVAKLEGQNPGRLGQGPGIAVDDRSGRGGRHPHAGHRRSSSHRRATPASRWP